MLKPRIIPSLLVQDGGLVKTTNFKNPRYIGDPINAVKIFNEKEADELAVFDIDASTKNREPNYRLIERLANECRMPLCYGGGIKTLEQATKILNYGVEKIVVSSLVFENPSMISRIASYVGTQSVAVALDVKKTFFSSQNEIYSHNGTKKTGRLALEIIPEIIHLGAGELIINSIDRDGIMKGFDLELLKEIKSICSVPITVLGGAGSLDHIRHAIQELGIVGVACGSLFIYKGIHKAVLINYPNRQAREELFSL